MQQVVDNKTRRMNNTINTNKMDGHTKTYDLNEINVGEWIKITED